MKTIENYQRKSVHANLKDFCYLSDNDGFVELTEWHNGEGVDVCIASKNKSVLLQLTHGELDAIAVLAKML